MSQYCFARWRLLSSVTLPAGRPVTGCVGSPAADTPRLLRPFSCKLIVVFVSYIDVKNVFYVFYFVHVFYVF